MLTLLFHNSVCVTLLCNSVTQTCKLVCVQLFLSLQGLDDASAMGPSELILTRGTLNEEEERESDTDDIDHEGKGMRPETAHLVRKSPLYLITCVDCKESLENKQTLSHLNTCVRIHSRSPAAMFGQCYHSPTSVRVQL